MQTTERIIATGEHDGRPWQARTTDRFGGVAVEIEALAPGYWFRLDLDSAGRRLDPRWCAIRDTLLLDHDLAAVLDRDLTYITDDATERRAAHATRAVLLADCETNGRACYLRYGLPPRDGHSWNARDERPEPGVSVYAAYAMPGGRYVLDLRGVDAFSAMFIATSDTPVYRATGSILTERGSDGEPLLADVRTRRIHPTAVQRLV